MSLSSIKCLRKMYSWAVHPSFASFLVLWKAVKPNWWCWCKSTVGHIAPGKSTCPFQPPAEGILSHSLRNVNYWESLYPLGWCNETSLEKQNLWNRVLTIILVILFINVAFRGCKTWILQRLYCCVCGLYGTDMSIGWEELAFFFKTEFC